jgi:hypothetical protein
MTAPVVLISFNRPELTRRTLDRIRAAAPSELFLLADGPRADQPDDHDRCAAVRRELEAVDWPCTTHRRFSDINLGCEASTELGLDWVFSQVPAAIILEDDCLPVPDFFTFCTELLDRYREDARVWQIAGNAPDLAPELFSGLSYAMAAFGSIWGWATWRRAWSNHRARLAQSHAGPVARRRSRPDLAGSQLVTRAGRRYFSDVARDVNRTQFGWDSYWCLSIVSANAFVATPATNLVENIGSGPDATHGRGGVDQVSARAIGGPLTHPPDVALNPGIERGMERIVASHVGRAARFFAWCLPHGPVRDLARRLASRWRTARRSRGANVTGE